MKNKLVMALVVMALLPTAILAQAAIDQSTLQKAGTLPDSPFYGFKRAIEGIQLVLTFDETKKAELHLQFAERRIAEAEVLIAKGKPDLANKPLQDYSSEIEEAQSSSFVLHGENATILQERIANATGKHTEVLNNVLQNAPDAAKPAIENAINVSQQGHTQALVSVGGYNR